MAPKDAVLVPCLVSLVRRPLGRPPGLLKVCNVKLESILKTLQSLQNDVTNCNSRLALFESRSQQQKTALRPDRVTDYDSITLLGPEDIALDSVNEEEAIKPSNEAEMPTNEAVRPPNKVMKPPNEATKLPNDNSSSSEETRIQMRTSNRLVMTPTFRSHPGNPPRIFLHSWKRIPSETKL